MVYNLRVSFLEINKKKKKKSLIDAIEGEFW